MTLGIDVSSLFNQVCMLSCCNSLLTKKMVNLYISQQAQQNPELSLMGVNTFLKLT